MPALPVIAGVDVVIIGLVASMLGFSLYPLYRPLLQAALGGLPYVGPWIAQHVEDLLAAAYGAAMLGVSTAAQPLADLLRALHGVQDTLTRYITGTFDNVFNRLWRLVNHDLVALEQQVEARADQEFEAAIQHADQVGAAAIQRADQEFEWAIEHADQVGLAAIARADQEFEAAIQHADQVGAAALGYAQQLAQALEQLEQAGEAASAQYAGQLAQGVLEYVQAALKDLGLEIEQVGSQAEGYAQTLEQIAVQHADQVGAAVAAAAAAATAAVASQVQSIEDSPCMKACNPLGDIGGLVQGLEDAGLLALLLGLAGQAIRDPQGLARELDDAVVVPAQAGLAALRSLGL